MVTDWLFLLQLLSIEYQLGLVAILLTLMFPVMAAVRQVRRRRGFWGVLRALSYVELGYRCFLLPL